MVSGKAATRGWVPDQHGAWVMVTVPLLLGVWLAGPVWVHVPLAIAWYAGYFAFFAVSWWIRARGKRKRAYVPALIVYSVVCVFAAIAVVIVIPRVVVWAVVFVPLMSVAIFEAYRRRPRSLASGLSTVLASAAMIPLASYVAGQELLEPVWSATFLVALYFCGTIFYVKSLIRERKNLKFLRESVAFHIVMLVAAIIPVISGERSWLVLVVFALLALRSWLMPWWGAHREKPWTPKFVGLTEMISTALVVGSAVL